MIETLDEMLSSEKNRNFLRKSYEKKKAFAENVKFCGLNHSKSLERKSFATFDTETKDGLKGKELFCYSLAYKQERSNELTVFQNTDSELNDLFVFFEQRQKEREKNKKQKRLIIFVHNLSFDERFIRQQLVKRNIDFHVISSGSNIIALSIPSFHVRFVDSVQFLQESQEKAEITWEIDEKLRKIECTFIFNTPFEKWGKEEKTLVLEHNKQDVKALFEIMQKVRTALYEIVNVDILNCVSIASSALKAFRKNTTLKTVNPFLFEKKEKGKRLKYELSKYEAEFCRKGYYGGRTEVFDLSLQKNVCYFDKVSLYPYCLFAFDYPLGKAYWETNPHTLNQHIDSLDKLGMIFARIEQTYNDYYPILPFREEEKVMFNCKEKTGVYTSVELNYARKYGYVITPINGFIFEEKGNPFKPFISKLFEVKKTSKGGKRQMSKIEMNGCYGKFGEDFERLQYETQFYPDFNTALSEQNRCIEKGVKCGLVKHFEDESKFGFDKGIESISMKPHQNVVWAAFCTAYGRLELHKGLMQLYEKGILATYCDTDSIVAPNTEEVKQILQIGDELGNWQIEHTFIEAKFFASKLYAFYHFNEKTKDFELILKLKGLDRATLKRELSKCKTVSDIEAVFKAKKLESQEKYTTLRRSAYHGKILCSNSIIKEFSFKNTKREQIGTNTKPWGFKIEKTA